MEKRKLGRTEHFSTVAIFGGAAFWDITQSVADTVMEQVIAAGVNHIDVAPQYGVAEERLGPWLKREQEENTGRELPREGIGCWHPLFPARVDDIWVLAGITVKYLEGILSSSQLEPNLTVFEQSYDETGFTGFRKVNLD